MGGGWDAETPISLFPGSCLAVRRKGDAAPQGSRAQVMGTAAPTRISWQGTGEQPEHLPLLP